MAAAEIKATEVGTGLTEIKAIAGEYSAAQSKADAAQIAADAAGAALADAKTGAALIANANTAALAAQTVSDETAAQTAQANAETAKVTFTSKLELAYVKASEVATLLVEVRAIKVAEIAKAEQVACEAIDGTYVNNECNLPTVGTVFDGVINGATVCMDINTNSVCDAGEPMAITDVFGSFSMNANGLTGRFIMSGGTDMGTGLPFTGTMTAPAGSTAVSPLTSAIQSLIETGATPAEAEMSIKKALNIKSDVALTSYNPFTAATAGDENAKEILAAQSQLQILVEAVSTTVAGADSATESKETMADAMANIARSLEMLATLAGDTDVVITNKLVSDAIKATANKVYATNPVAKIAAKAVADASAEAAIVVANDTKAKVTAANLADATLVANTGILVANSSMKNALETSVGSAATTAAALTTAQLAAIDDAQNAQEAADAKIAAVAKAAADAKAARIAAEAAAAAADATQANIVALEEAKAAQAEQEILQAVAEKMAADAATAAANLEAQIAATEAALKATMAANAAAKAAAAEALAVAQKVAAETAATNAAAASDAASAKAAADAANVAAAVDIATKQVAADAAAKAAADAMAAAEAAAKYAAEDAAQAAMAAAQAAADAAKAAASTFTIDELNGQTFYYIAYDDFGDTTQLGWNMAKMDFSATTFIWNEYNSSTSGDIIINYIVDANGRIDSTLNEGFEFATFTKLSTASDYYKICMRDTNHNTTCTSIEPRDQEYMFFDEAKALSFRDSQNIVVTPPVTTDGGFFEEMVLGSFYPDDDGTIKSYHTALSGGAFVHTNTIFEEATATFIERTDSNNDIVLNNNGDWVETSSYTISNGMLTLVESGEIIKIDKALDLVNPTTQEELDQVAKINELVPGDVNITFSAGAEAYVFSFQNIKDRYTLYDAPSNCSDWNNTTNSCNVTPIYYSDLISFMNSGHSPSGSRDSNGNWIAVQFQRDTSANNSYGYTGYPAIDSNGSVVSALSVGVSGNLVTIDLNNTETVVGSWSVIELPYNAGVAIILTPSVLSAFKNPDDNLIAVASSKVYRGKRDLASPDFIANSDEVDFNLIAFDDITAAIKNSVVAQPVAGTNPITTTLMQGDGIWGEYNADNTLHSCYDFNDNGTFSYAEDTGVWTLGIQESNNTLRWLDENNTIVGPVITVADGYSSTLINFHLVWTDDAADRQLRKMDSCTLSTYEDNTTTPANLGTPVALPIDKTGRVIYKVYYDNGIKKIGELSFTTPTQVEYTGYDGTAGELATYIYAVSGNELTISDLNGTAYGAMAFYLPTDTSSPYVMIGYWNSFIGHTNDTNYYFTTLSDAQNFALTNINEEYAKPSVVMDMSMLSGKTFYDSFQDYDGSTFYNMMVLSSQDNQAIRIETRYDGNGAKTVNTFVVNFDIVDGNIRADGGNNDWLIFKFMNISSNPWEIVRFDDFGKDGSLDTIDANTRWYTDLTTANFPDNLYEEGNTTTPVSTVFTASMLSANDWYELEYGGEQNGCIGKKTYNLDGTFNHSDNSGVNISGTYIINSTGEFTHVVSGVVSKYNTLISATPDLILYNGWDDTDTTVSGHRLYKNQTDAEAFLQSINSQNYCYPVDTTTPVTPSIAFTDGMVFSEFWLENETIYAHQSILSSGLLEEKKFLLDATTGDFIADTISNSNSDIVLALDGNWVEWNNNYTITNGIITFTGSGEMIRMDRILNLDNPSTQEELDLIARVNEIVPGNVNVTFSAGAEANVGSFKNMSDTYSLWNVVADCTDWNNTTNSCNVTPTPFSDLVTYMNSGYSPSGSRDSNGNFIGVEFQRDTSANNSYGYTGYPAIDSNGGIVSALSVGVNGNLVTVDSNNTETVVGSWSVIELPYNAGIAIILLPDSAHESAFGVSENLVAVVNSMVYRGERTLASTEFVEYKDTPMDLNLIAFNDIRAAIKNYVVTQPSVSPLVDLLAGKTFWTGSSGILEKISFSQDMLTSSWEEIVHPTDGLCYGTVSVDIVNDTTVNITGLTDSCGLDNNNTETSTVSTSSANYLMFGQQKFYFNEEDARADFLSTIASKYTTAWLNGKTLYNTFYESNQNKWLISVFDFTDTTFSEYRDENTSNSVNNVPYSITQEGYISFLHPVNNTMEYVKATEQTADYQRLCWTDQLSNLSTCTGDNEYFYFDYQKALLFKDAQNAIGSANSQIVDNFPTYKYRALGVGGDTVSSKAEIAINGVTYTVFAMSETNVANPSTSGDFAVALATMDSNTVPQIALGADYLNNLIVLKAYSSTTTFDATTFAGQSTSVLVDASYVDFGDITIQ